MTPNAAKTIDLNADLGEDPAALADGRDADLAALVSSLNVACGGHAGDDGSMRALARIARDLGRALGAHPSYPDRAGFGRHRIEMTPAAIERSVAEQIRRLHAIAAEFGVPLSHIKPHGALYHDCSARPEVAAALASAIRSVDPSVAVVALAGSPAEHAFRDARFRTFAEGFPDRAYLPDGSLAPRSTPGSVIHDPEHAARQAVALATGGDFPAIDGTPLRVRCRTLCLHSDTRDATAIARAVRRALESAGIGVRPG